MTANENLLKILIIIWPLIIAVQAAFYRKKQNGMNPWTGGPISWPKAFWLAYTIYSWFFLPIIFYIHPALDKSMINLITFHLISWWGRGILELFMIYKWFNWSPRYGISHDLFHLIGIGSILILNRAKFIGFPSNSINYIVLMFYCFLLFSTIAEIFFAFSFMRLRTVQELNDNIYFASDDPKWLRINRITLIVVCISFCHLLIQSILALKI